MHIPHSGSDNQSQVCLICKALLPIHNFCLFKERSNGHHHTCRKCRSQYNRYKRHLKFKSPLSDEDQYNRNIRHHNLKVCKALFESNRDASLLAYSTTNLEDYKVDFTISPVSGVKTITCHLSNENPLSLGIPKSLIDDVDVMVSDFFSDRCIRLELTQLDLIMSKHYVYSINIPGT
jgi:ribosomal protein L40E